MTTNKADSDRVKELLAFSLGIINGEDGKTLIDKYIGAIEQVTPFDMLELEDKQIQLGVTTQIIKKNVNKVINILFDKLKNYNWEKPKQGTFLYYLMLENQGFVIKLNNIKRILKNYKGIESKEFEKLKLELLPLFEEFKQFDAHYAKKENILFPFLENKLSNYRPLKVMWSLHDDLRKQLKQIIEILNSPDTQWKDFTPILGSYFFLAFGMIQKEEYIVYPVASEFITNVECQSMHNQSFEYPFPFIEKPTKRKTETENIISTLSTNNDELIVKTETGELNIEQLVLLLNNLPVDITFVDENNKVRYFSKPKDRFFARSPAIIGRAVENCHPPESVHIVEKIINAFKNNEKDTAKFWLTIKDKFILIQYFAMRNSSGEYKGVLEVSQDVTDIRLLKGEQRLLDWE